MRFCFLCFFILLFCRPGISEPAFGQLIGPENDFLKYDCLDKSAGIKECEFSQILMSVKVKPEDVEAEISKRLATIVAQLDQFKREAVSFCPTMLGFIKEMPELVEALVAGDEAAAIEVFERLPEEMRDEASFDDLKKQFAQSVPEEVEDAIASFQMLQRLCEEQSLEAFEAMTRHDVEKDARTCKLFVNEWKETFEKVSDTNWVISDGGPRGECGVVRLDRFECRGRFLCDFVSEKRVLNPDDEPLGGIPCSGLEEGEFRYTYDGDGVYTQCEIMSFY